MFFGYILICSSVAMEISPETCAHVTSPVLYVSEDICYADVDVALNSFTEAEGAGSFVVVEYQCVETNVRMSEDT